MTILAFRDTITEHDNLLGPGLGLLLPAINVAGDHVLEVGDDFGTTFLQADTGDEAVVLAVDGSDRNGDRGRDRSATGRRVSDVRPNHHGGLVKLHVSLRPFSLLGFAGEGTDSLSHRDVMSDTAELGVNLHRDVAEVLQETLVVGSDLGSLQTLGDDGLIRQLCRISCQ